MLTEYECDAARVELEQLAEHSEQGGLECLFNKARVFERVYQIPDLLRLIRHFLGPDAILSGADGSIIEPGKGGDGLHADGALTGHLRPRSQAAVDEGSRVTSHALGLNTIFCISDFNLTNGARIERINWIVDTSHKGLGQAAGMMVNYRYKPGDIEANHEAFKGAKRIVASSAVKSLLSRRER